MGIKSFLFSALFLSTTLNVQGEESGHSKTSWTFAATKKFLSKNLPYQPRNTTFSLPTNCNHVKLDIGLSREAWFSQIWMAKQDDLVVIGFEPNVESIQSVLKGVALPQCLAADFLSSDHPIRTKSQIPELFGKRFFTIPCALGLSKDKFTKFFVTQGDPGCSSLYKPNDFAVSKIIKVPVITLEKFFDHFPFDTHPLIDYIKVDAQGSDLDIAKSGGHYLRERVVCITMEAEQAQYAGTKNSVEMMDAYMESIGFEKYTSKNFSDPTYVNIKFKDYFLENEVFAFQQ
ncbi:MAG: FkbM family methyltransferase [Chlamydiia bacterium]